MSFLPPIKIDYLISLTDDTGLLQHAKYSTPNRQEGYTIDDNSRALIASVKLAENQSNQQINTLTEIYLSFLLHMQKSDGSFHNMLSYNREYLDREGSEDSHGRTLWAAGVATLLGPTEGMQITAKEIFDRGLPYAYKFNSLRARAFAILGLCHYHKAFPDDPNVLPAIKDIQRPLITYYKAEAASDWHWFESYLVYENARLPQALLRAYDILGREEDLKIATEALDFLNRTQTINEIFVPIGNKGWYKRGGKRAIYDQQPVEAASTVESAIDAYKTAGQRRYLDLAVSAFTWFFGKNTKKVQVYRPKNGACYDGISAEGVNKNQGAEATVSFLLARLAMGEIKDELKLNEQLPTR